MTSEQVRATLRQTIGRTTSANKGMLPPGCLYVYDMICRTHNTGHVSI